MRDRNRQRCGWGECRGPAALHSAPRGRQQALYVILAIANGVGKPRTDYTSCSITDLVVLRFGQLNEKLRDLVLDLHLAKDCRAVVCDGDVSIGGDKNFVEAWRGLGKD